MSERNYPMLLVYTHKITPRLTYIFKHIFTRILNVQVNFTLKIEDFIAHEGLKMSYGRQQLGNEFFVRSTDLLFDQGIDYWDPQITEWEEIPIFFQVSAPSMMPFDIFSASFYLLSRYEEYLPHVKDEFERFPASESFAYQQKFLHKPIIDIWSYKLRDLLQKRFPDFVFEKREFKLISTIDVDMAYCYRHKGFIRNLGGLLKDLAQLQFQKIVERLLIVFNLRKDPYDIYEDLIELHKKYDIELIFFFLLSNYTSFDKNISVNNSRFKLLIKDLADYVSIGLHPSYFSMKDEQKIKEEKKRLDNILNYPVKKSRHHYLRIELPETYQYLLDLEINEDYTMGFAKHYGFRAGTCTPFYFYDLDFEIQTPLKIFPFAVMDGTLKDYLNYTTKRSFDTMSKLLDEVKKVDGTMITIFHNESLSGTGRWKGWNKKFEEFLAKANGEKE
ncbi:polysaccharide deacetylase family protein [Namhaeicola litoreus]|uniref:Polysaccharide deacetylase family protein n=1 Tax=Namhaeicola litoreus TaxID=1052145 RepID=A0ABW3Y883_9FLAO